MKKIIILFAIFNYLIVSFAQENHIPLFRIYENGLYGYIDSTGKIVIPPKYKNAGEFSEGLAPVRENGYYGYIDETGKYVIDPQYDYAENFNYNYAIIYEEGKPNFINKFGVKLTSSSYLNIYQFKKNLVQVCTFSGKYGVLNTKGKLIIDTAYKEITHFNDGISIVIDYNSQFSAIDTSGKIIVKPGIYHRINNFSKGFAKVFCNENIDGIPANCDRGYINTKGELIFSQKLPPRSELSDYVSHDSLFILTENPAEDKTIYSLMDMKGNVIKVLDNKSFQMNRNVIYILDSNSLYHEIDIRGNTNGNKVFLDWNGDSHMFGFKGDTLMGIIDTSLDFAIKPSFNLIYYVLNSEYLIFAEFVRDTKGNYIYDRSGYNVRKYGICTNKGEIILYPTIDDYDYENGYLNGLLLCKIEGKTAYINEHGEIVWIQTSSNEPRYLDIDYKLQTWYTIDYYGWRTVKHSITDTSLNGIEYIEDNFSIILSRNEKSIFNKYYNGISLYIINDCDHSIRVPSVDGALYIVLEAKDRSGKWRQIESFPSSWCGNSYVKSSLNPKYFLKFSVPDYRGGYRTKLRAVLEIYNNKEKHVKIYSNEISGSINPAQFWRENNEYQLQEFFEKYISNFER